MQTVSARFNLVALFCLRCKSLAGNNKKKKNCASAHHDVGEISNEKSGQLSHYKDTGERPIRGDARSNPMCVEHHLLCVSPVGLLKAKTTHLYMVALNTVGNVLLKDRK